MPSQDDIVANMIAVMRLREPDLDLGIGSVVRKIFDVAAGEMAQVYLDRFLLSYGFDIDQKSGGDLDDFVQLFGMVRKQPTRARGVVTFSRTASIAQTKQVTIPVNTQVVAPGTPNVYAVTSATAVLPLGQESVDVPVTVSTPGSVGNIVANQIATSVSSIDGVTSTRNATSFSGGLDIESDEALRNRWREDRFRNLAGTDSMYSALARQATSSVDQSEIVTKVNVIGSKRTTSQQVAVVAGTVTTSLASASYIYPRSVFLGDDISGGDIAIPGTDYTLTVNNGASPPTVTATSLNGRLVDGIYEIEYDYVPRDSRNDPAGTRFGSSASVTNRVDIWVNGESLITATQSCTYVPTTPNTFSTNPASDLYTGKYAFPSGSNPTAGDIITPLAFGPVTDLPDTITVNGTVYHIGTDYQLANRIDAFGMAPQSYDGICWRQTGNVPPTTTAFTVEYTYNEIPTIIQLMIDLRARLQGTDVWVHAGRATRYAVNLGIVYDRISDRNIVNINIQNALSTYMAGLGFASPMQVSDIQQVVHNVAGVDNVRLLTAADDATNYGLQVRRADGTLQPPAATAGRSRDIQFADSQYPLLDSVRIVAMATNTFGVA